MLPSLSPGCVRADVEVVSAASVTSGRPLEAGKSSVLSVLIEPGRAGMYSGQPLKIYTIFLSLIVPCAYSVQESSKYAGRPLFGLAVLILPRLSKSKGQNFRSSCLLYCREIHMA